MNDEPKHDATGQRMSGLDADEVTELVGDGTGHALPPMTDEPTLADRLCGTCTHHDGTFCLLNPPQVVIDIRNRPRTRFPETSATSRCGQWRHR